jgi:hypothetical protein
MQQKANRNQKFPNAIDELLDRLFLQAKVQFGDVVRSSWFYDSDLCPACTRRSIGVIKINEKIHIPKRQCMLKSSGT